VDEGRKITSQSGGRGLNSWGKSELYLGGVERSMEEKLLRATGERLGKGLTGCIDDVTVRRGQHRMNTTMANARTLHRISDCSSKHPCDPNPCLHSADCLVANIEKDILSAEVVGNANDKFTSFCQCSVLHTGKFCEVPTNLTDPCLFDPCKKGEVCRVKSDFATHECLCADERGRLINCSHKVVELNTTSIDISNLPASNKTLISFEFKANRKNGLIFSNSNSTEFVLEEGNIKMKISKIPYTIHKNITFEQWTEIEITSSNNKISYLVNDKPFKIYNSITLDKNQPLIISSLSTKSSNKTNSIETNSGTFKTFFINGVDMIKRKKDEEVLLEETRRKESLLDVNEIN